MKRSFAITLAGTIAAATAAIAAYVRVIRPWHLRWGATDEEAARSLLGDGFVPFPKLNATHAVTIYAPTENVWQWLVQIGQGRGGFYSYDFVENAMGLDIHNADCIVPELQELKIGDKIPLSPDGFGIPVACIEPGRTLVLHGDTRLDPSTIPTMQPGDFFAVSWAWYLEPINEKITRLIERWRADWNPTAQNQVFMRAFLEPGAFVMERKMLLGIKERAERHAINESRTA